MPLKMCSSMCNCVAARWLLGWQPGSFTSWPTTTTRQRNILSPGSTGQALSAVKICLHNMLKTPHSFEYNCFEFFKLSCEYETEFKLFVGTSLVFSHTTCSWSTAKKSVKPDPEKKSVQSIAVGMTTDVERALGQWHKSLAKFLH